MAGFDVDIQNIGELRGSGNSLITQALQLNEETKSFSNRIEALTDTWDADSRQKFIEIKARFHRAFVDLFDILGDLGGRVVKVSDSAQGTEEAVMNAMGGPH